MDCDCRELGDRFVEYCFQVPANRIGHYEFSAAQLKTIQEVITLVVFCVFSVLDLKEPSQVELSCRLCADGRCRVSDLQRVVIDAAQKESRQAGCVRR